jgi:hypothetical protein
MLFVHCFAVMWLMKLLSCILFFVLILHWEPGSQIGLHCILLFLFISAIGCTIHFTLYYH